MLIENNKSKEEMKGLKMKRNYIKFNPKKFLKKIIIKTKQKKIKDHKLTYKIKIRLLEANILKII